jgi:transketolase
MANSLESNDSRLPLGCPLPIVDLEAIAKAARREIVKTVTLAKGGHLGGPLSATDILVALYFRVLSIRPEEPAWPERDRFILSKGHSSIALYVILALRGFFPLQELQTFDALNSRLQGHPDMNALPGLDMSTGSLGLGLSAAVGVAMGAKLAGARFATFVMVGDGECNEGVVWEAAHVAQRNHLDNLVVVVDENKLQQFGWGGLFGKRQAPYADGELRSRWTAFGWNVSEVDGHDIAAVIEALERARTVEGAPAVIIAHTVKGKGVSFMEGNFRWHSQIPTEVELAAALSELSASSTQPIASRHE